MIAECKNLNKNYRKALKVRKNKETKKFGRNLLTLIPHLSSSTADTPLEVRVEAHSSKGHMPKLIKHINFTESQAAKLLTPKGKELITNQLLEADPQRTSDRMTQLFENMANLDIVNIAGGAALLYNDTLAGPLDCVLSKEGDRRILSMYA